MSAKATSEGKFAAMHPQIAEDASLTGRFFVLFHFEIRVPELDFSSAELLFTGLTYSTEVAYRGYVFLYPPAVEFNPADKNFRTRYLAHFLSVMAAPPDTPAGSTTQALLDVTGILARLAATDAGKTWHISVAITPTNEEKHRAGAPAADKHSDLKVQVGRCELIVVP